MGGNMKYNFYDDITMMNNFTPYDVNKMGVNDMNSSNLNNNDTTGQFKNLSDTFNYDFTNIAGFNGNDMGNAKMNNNLDLYSPYEGYMRGNAFQSQYIPYKNYRPQKISINSEKEEMLVNIGQYSFMAHEMNLYLDIHPNDRQALQKFQEFRDKANDLMKNYERKYGPLTVSGGISNQVPFNWVTSTWPWVE